MCSGDPKPGSAPCTLCGRAAAAPPSLDIGAGLWHERVLLPLLERVAASGGPDQAASNQALHDLKQLIAAAKPLPETGSTRLYRGRRRRSA